MDMRVGFGYDVHRLEEGQPFWLGGVRLEHHLGATGHSDADALIHAICDAMLGAANMRDIGHHFPDTDPTLRGIDSKILLQRTTELIAQKGYRVGNVDSTVCLQSPKIGPHIESMQQTLAGIMGLSPDEVSIKATTTERLGFVGREQGVAAYAVVLLTKEAQ
ncbi:MAG: 2-C-methyl-D-erythritol 2,4-cyclodiphosphate synthase [Bacteroidales bacterium]|nr:2-C-methyl-D-erythritol 2,4-cyclodiphosphate synthase [Bacteroidales bacterium]